MVVIDYPPFCFLNAGLIDLRLWDNDACMSYPQLLGVWMKFALICLLPMEQNNLGDDRETTKRERVEKCYVGGRRNLAGKVEMT